MEIQLIAFQEIAQGCHSQIEPS